MKSPFQIKSFVLGALLGTIAVVGIAAEKEGAHPTVWEYNIVDEHLGYATGNDYFWAQALTKKSAEGWDIVFSWRVDDTTVKMMLRRPKTSK